MTDPDGIHGNDREEQANCHVCNPLLVLDPAARFVALTEYKRKLQASLNEANEQLETAEAELLKDLDARNLDSVKTKDGWTVYARRELSVKTKDGTDVVVGLLALGEPALLTANWQRLKARVREWLTREDLGTWEIDEKRLPPAVAAAFEIGEFRKLGARKS